MPRLKRKSKKLKPRQLAVTRWHLTSDERPGIDNANRDALETAWHEQRDAILPAWLKDRPGTRPIAWYAFEAPGPRRFIGGIAEPVSWLLSNWICRPDVVDSQHEREVDYLRRHGLLIGDEAERFEAMRLRYEEWRSDLTTDAEAAWLDEKRDEYGDSEFGIGWRFSTRTGGVN